MSREDLLRAAADFLGRRPNATTDEIAEAVGVSRATLHRHFAGRRSLFAAVDELARDQMRAAVAEARLEEGDAAGALVRLVDASRTVAPYLALLYSQSQEFDDETDEAWEEVDAHLTALFRRGQEAGEFRLDLTPAWLTDAFYSLVVGASWTVRIGRAAANDYPHMIAGLLLHGAVRR